MFNANAGSSLICREAESQDLEVRVVDESVA